MSSGSRGPQSEGGRRDERRLAGGSDDDSMRGGFGGPRWNDLPDPVRPLSNRQDEPLLQERGFGSASWKGDPGDDEREDELGDEESGAPRRRKPPAPPPYPRKTLAALGGTVRVTRDELGIPHIAAKSERDAYVALGACMAEDRLWQLDVVRRLALGRASELFGESFARHDAVVRTAGVPRRAAAAAQTVSGGARDALAAFTAGVNAARAEARPAECELLGYEIEPWTVADSLAIELLLALSEALSVFADKLLLARVVALNGVDRARWISATPLDLASAGSERAALWRQLDLRILDLLADLPLECSLAGSAWACSREGAGGMLAGALSGSPGLPPPSYVAHLEAPGFSLAGIAHVGMPAFPIGRNRTCAWSGMAAAFDDADCVLEELDGIGNFRSGNGWTRLHARRELVRVRGGDGLQFEVLETRNGPLLSHLAEQLGGAPPDVRAPGIALRWGANSLGSAMGGWLAMARAKSLRDVAGAASLVGRGPLAMQVVGADSKGRVGSFTAGGLPVRDELARLPVRGWCGEAAWTGVQPIGSEIPRQAPEVALAATGEDAGSARLGGVVHRVQEVFAGGAPPALDDCRALQSDRADALARALLPGVRAALAGAAGTDEALREVAALLERWDGVASSDSRAAAIWYAGLLHFLPREVFPESRFGPLARFPRPCVASLSRILLADASPWFADASSRDRALVGALARAAAWQSEPGVTATWSTVAPLQERHLLSQHERFAAGVAEIPSPGGSPFSIAMLGVRAARLPFTVTHAPIARAAADLATDELQVALAGGESGVVGNAHFLDQLDAFCSGRVFVVRLGPDARGDLTELISG